MHDAQQHDLAPQEVLAIINHYQASPGAWQPGGLHYRIRTGTKGLPPDQGWPPPDSTHADAKREAAATAALLTERAKEDQAAADSAERYRLLESKFGKTLDAMDPAAIEGLADNEILRDLIKSQRKRDKGTRPTGMVRDLLLVVMEKRRK